MSSDKNGKDLKDRREMICRTAVQSALFGETDGVSNFERHLYNRKDAKQAVEMFAQGVLVECRDDLNIDEEYHDMKALVYIKKVIADEFESAQYNGRKFPDALRSRRTSPVPVELRGLWQVSSSRLKHLKPADETLKACQHQSRFMLKVQPEAYGTLLKHYKELKLNGVKLSAEELPMDLYEKQVNPFAEANKFTRNFEIKEFELIGNAPFATAISIIDPALRMYANSGGFGVQPSKFGRTTIVSAEALPMTFNDVQNFAHIIQKVHNVVNVDNWVSTVLKDPDKFAHDREAIAHAYGWERLHRTGMCDSLVELDARSSGFIIMMILIRKLWSSIDLRSLELPENVNASNAKKFFNADEVRKYACPDHPQGKHVDLVISEKLKHAHSHLLSRVSLSTVIKFVKMFRNRAMYGGGKIALAGAMTNMEQRMYKNDFGVYVGDWDYGTSDDPKHPTVPEWFRPQVAEVLDNPRAIMGLSEEFAKNCKDMIYSAFPFLPILNSYIMKKWQRSYQETGMPCTFEVGDYTYQPPPVQKWKGMRPFKLNFNRWKENVDGTHTYGQTSTTTFAYQPASEGTQALALWIHMHDAAIIARTCNKLYDQGAQCLTIHDALILSPKHVHLAQHAYWEAFCEVLGLTEEEFPFCRMLGC